MMNIEMEQLTQLPTIDTTSFMNNEMMTSNTQNNQITNNTQTESSKRRRKRKSSSEKTDGEKKRSKKSKGGLKCVYCAVPLSSKYCFCPECGNAIPKDISKEEINQMTERYKELERSNADLEKQYQIYQFQQQQLAEQQQNEQQQQTMTDLMWLVASIPKPLFNEKITLSDYTIRKISPAFAEFLGFQENKQLINAKMSKIVPSLPSHLSTLHTDYLERLSQKEDNTSFSKEEVFKNMYDELFLTTLQCTLYSSDKKPSLCIMVMTGYTKIDNIDCAFPNLNAPFQEISESQEN